MLIGRPNLAERSNPGKRGPARRQKSPALVSLGGASVGGKAKPQLVPRQTTPAYRDSPLMSNRRGQASQPIH
jgi:hypothetical protein